MPDDKDIVVINDNEWRNMTFKELKEVSKEYFDKHLKGKKVINIDNGDEIILTKSGWRHTFNKNIMDYESVVIFKELNNVIKYAKYKGFGNRNEKDSITTLGYLNYETNILINNEILVKVKLSVRIDRYGKFYYDHYIKEKSPHLYGYHVL